MLEPGEGDCLELLLGREPNGGLDRLPQGVRVGAILQLQLGFVTGLARSLEARLRIESRG